MAKRYPDRFLHDAVHLVITSGLTRPHVSSDNASLKEKLGVAVPENLSKLLKDRLSKCDFFAPLRGPRIEACWQALWCKISKLRNFQAWRSNR